MSAGTKSLPGMEDQVHEDIREKALPVVNARADITAAKGRDKEATAILLETMREHGLRKYHDSERNLTVTIEEDADGEETEIAALRAALAERGKDLVDAADSLFKAVARADAAEEKLKKAEEVIKTLTIADDRHFDEMSKAVARADTAEAKLKKAEEERDAQTRRADVTLAKMCDAWSLSVRPRNP